MKCGVALGIGAGDEPMGTEHLPESPTPDPDRPADACHCGSPADPKLDVPGICLACFRFATGIMIQWGSSVLRQLSPHPEIDADA